MSTAGRLVAAAGLGAVAALLFMRIHSSIARPVKSQEEQAACVDTSINDNIRPPFPTEIISLLDAASLCYLATANANTPHLSLMIFTYCRERETLIFSTRRETLKCQHLQANPNVSVLVHDFPHLLVDTRAGAKSGTYAITLNGKARVLNAGAEADFFREKHLERNPNMANFIAEPAYAMVAVTLEGARVSNSQDQVSNWNAANGWITPPPLPR